MLYNLCNHWPYVSDKITKLVLLQKYYLLEHGYHIGKYQAVLSTLIGSHDIDTKFDLPFQLWILHPYFHLAPCLHVL